ncbi:MAG: prepilin-type N-terminal cleavage/methylation domain-containing protein [Actinomycetota bacterium]
MSRQSRARARARNEHGFTLLELVVAMTIFGIVMLGIAATLGTGLALTRTNRHRSVAANLAAQEMDAVRSADFDSIVASAATVDVDGITYTVVREATWVAKSATAGPCDGGGSPQVLRVRVSVTWPDMRGVAPVASDTTLTPPVGSYDPNTGHIGVKVLDRDAGNLFNVPVVVTGPSNRNAPTNSDGCAFFAFLPAGTYTVELGSVGYVDRQSNPEPSQTLGVTVGNISSVQFDYDQAASLELTLQTDYANPSPDDLPITVASPQLVPNGLKSYAGTGTVRTIADLFPFLEGYNAWAGSCADADPEGRIIEDVGGNPVDAGPYWPGATREALIEVQGGQVSTRTVHLHDADVTVTDALGLPIAGAEVVATHAPDNLCDTGETHVAGTTDPAGVLRVALPYGTWELSVTGWTAVGAWPEAVIDPNAHTPVAVVAVAQ